MKVVRSLPHPADYAAPPGPGERMRWEEADRDNRVGRVARLRARLAAGGFDAYFGVGAENSRYLTGFRLDDCEEKVAGQSGRFIVTGDQVVVFADSRYREQAHAQAAGARIEDVYHNLPERWPALMESTGAKRVAAEGTAISHSLWTALEAAAPDVELVPVEGWVEADRAIKEPAEIDRIRVACAVADRALAAIVRRIKPGQTEQEIAVALEWEMRNGGADALAFPIACLAGPQAALPHGSPGEREARRGQVLLFDFGAKVDGYRSDMTRTLFVGEPTQRDLAIYEIVASAQQAALDLVTRAAAGDEAIPTGRAADGAARAVIEAAGYGARFGHGTGHGIGLATHELPSLGRLAPETPLPSPTVFSIEPGIYLDGETGVRIEDLVLFDAAGRRVERLTSFPRDPIVVGV